MHRIFLENPSRLVRTPWGAEFPAPFHCYRASSTALLGRIGAGAVSRLLEPEGVSPLLFEDAGARTFGGAQLAFVDYQETNYGPYRELVFSLFVTRRAEKPLPWRNPAALLCLQEEPERVVFTQDLHLDSDRGIEAGRDVGGMPKHPARLDYDYAAGRYRVRRESALVASLDLDLESTAASRASALGALEECFGAERLAELGERDVESYAVTTPRALKQVWMTVQIAAPAEIGLVAGRTRWHYPPAAELGFEPLLVSRMPHVQYVMSTDDPNRFAMPGQAGPDS